MAIQTLFDELNALLGNGFNEGEIILISFDERNAARIFSQYLKPKDGKAIFLCTDFRPSEINTDAIFIDAYSFDKGIKPRETDLSTSVSNINEISLDLSSMISNNDIKAVIIFSISTLFNRNPRDSVMSFLEVISAKTREKNAVLILFIDDKHHEKETLKAISNVYLSLITKEDKVTLNSNIFPIPLEFIIFAEKLVVK
jgi:predicted ATP-dependent serine protease